MVVNVLVAVRVVYQVYNTVALILSFLLLMLMLMLMPLLLAVVTAEEWSGKCVMHGGIQPSFTRDILFYELGLLTFDHAYGTVPIRSFFQPIMVHCNLPYSKTCTDTKLLQVIATFHLSYGGQPSGFARSRRPIHFVVSVGQNFCPVYLSLLESA